MMIWRLSVFLQCFVGQLGDVSAKTSSIDRLYADIYTVNSVFSSTHEVVIADLTVYSVRFAKYPRHEGCLLKYFEVCWASSGI